jgi:DNA-binding LacI/PurR family transcriptional regulator
VPFVTAGRRIEGLDSCFVGVDNFALGKLVTRHLIKRGRRRIAHLSGPDNMTSVLRCQGYLSALSGAGLSSKPGFIVPCGEKREVAHEAIRTLLTGPGRPDAVFAYNDLFALEAFRIIKSAGLRVPEDIALAGVGNNRYSDLLATPLTTVDQHPQRMGEKAAELLLAWVKEKRMPQKREIHVSVRLIARESTAGRAGPKR